MKFLDKLAMKRIANSTTDSDTIISNQISEFMRGLGVSTGGDNLSEVTYLTCLKALYESLGKINFDVLQDTQEGTKRIYNHELVPFLRQRPNPHQTPSTFKQLMERNRNHYGNAYALIERDQRTGRLLCLTPLHPPRVKVLVDDQNLLGLGSKLYYQYTNPHTSNVAIFDESDVLHVKFSLTDDTGLVGRSVQEVLASTMDGAKASQDFLNRLYKNGMTAAAVLEYVGDLDQKKVESLRNKIESFGAGAENAGRIMPIPPGTKVVPLDLSLSDSQFFELKKYNALQIASVFGVKPSQLNDYEKSSFASSEAQNLSFYVDTLLAILKQYEEEIDYKLISSSDVAKGIHAKANVSCLLRADLKTQSEILATYVNNAILTPNEARGELDRVDNSAGDTLVCNGNYIPLDQVGNQYSTKGGED